MAALYALGFIGDRRSLPVLEHFASEHVLACSASISRLAAGRWEAAARLARRVDADGNPDGNARSVADAVLYRLGDVRALDRLRRRVAAAQSDEDRAAPIAVLLSLAGMLPDSLRWQPVPAPPPTSDLLEPLPAVLADPAADGHHPAVLTALQRFRGPRDPRAEAVAREWTRRQGPFDWRNEGFGLLLAQREGAHGTILRALLDDQDPSVRTRAARDICFHLPPVAQAEERRRILDRLFVLLEDATPLRPDGDDGPAARQVRDAVWLS